MAMEGESRPKTSTVLMFPWLAHGHISPFLHLSRRLSATNYFTIYLCTTAINLDSIKSSIEREFAGDDPWITLVELHLPSSPQLPPELHTTKNLPPNLLPALIQAFQTSSSSFSDIMDSVKPDLLIYDFFQPWAPKIASSKGVPSVYFLTSGAASFSYYHHVYTIGTGSTFPYPAISLPDDDLIRLRSRIAPYVKDADDDFAFGNFTRSNGIVLVKSCRDVEDKYVDYLSVLCKKRMVCTGPLIAEDASDYIDEESWAIIEWLSGKNRRSTVYISFGSECFLSKEQIAEIAKGLQLCEVDFLWVVRFPVGGKLTSIEEELPEGFVETVRERGLFVPRWAPQTKILAHPSIGSFVSHCGWSSVMESMYFGVPVITMPMRAEQPINAQLAVEAGIGVEVGKDSNGLYVGEEVAKAINKVMVGEAFCEGLRSRVRKLSETIRGREEQEVNEVAEQLSTICMKNKKQL